MKETRLRFGLSFFAVTFLAFALALGSAIYVVSQELFVARLVSGPWSAALYLASEDAGPYTLAIRARRGTIPTPVAEAVAFFTSTDSAKEPLMGNCDYRLIGHMPPSRLWTLAIDVATGESIRPPLRPSGYPTHQIALHSDAVIRRADNSIELNLAATIRPGNWIQVPTSGPFQLAARIYDTPIGEDLSRRPLELPHIEKLRCR